MKLFKIIGIILSQVIGISTAETNLVNASKSYLDVPYAFEGRSRKNLDCLGLVFLSYARVSGKLWRQFPVNPWELIEQKTFGEPVKGLDGVLTNKIDFSLFIEDDFIHILSINYYHEGIKPIANMNGIDYYGVHLGIYVGEGDWIHANPYSAFQPKVILHSFKDFIRQTGTQAIFVTRLNNPQ